MEKFELAKGVKDWYGEEAILRNKITETLRNVFESYGFPPLETPVIERLDTLGFKGGGEIQKEVFTLQDQGKRDLGLRFDQTVPFARFIACHPELKFPFKRHVIGPVFRDGPTQPDQGRYRIFTQCDVDVAGVKEMTAEAELFGIAKDSFKALNLGGVDVKINNRKLLEGILEEANIPEYARERAIITLDKADKIGSKGVQRELYNLKLNDDPSRISDRTFDLLKERFKGSGRRTLSELSKELITDLGIDGYQKLISNTPDEMNQGEFISLIDSFTYDGNNLLNEDQVKRLLQIIEPQSSNEETLKRLQLLVKNKIGQEGLDEVRKLIDYSERLEYDFINFDPTLARGLSYYTGTTIEVYLKDRNLVSSAILAGGRFDNMIGDFRGGGEEIPAVGFSFGLERLAMVLSKNSVQPKSTTQIYLIPVGDTTDICLVVARNLREQGLNVDMEMCSGNKIKKSIKYADSYGIPYVGMIGDSEIQDNTLTVKNLKTGNQETIPIQYAKKIIK